MWLLMSLSLSLATKNCKILINMSNLLSLINETFHLVFSSRTSRKNFQTYVGISLLQIEEKFFLFEESMQNIKEKSFFEFLCVWCERRNYERLINDDSLSCLFSLIRFFSLLSVCDSKCHWGNDCQMKGEFNFLSVDKI